MAIGDRQPVNYTFQASASNAAGGTTTGTERDISLTYNNRATARVTNGATGPTIGATVTFKWRFIASTGTQYSQDFAPLPTTNSGVYDVNFAFPDGAVAGQVVFSGNTGQAVTVECYGGGEKGPAAS